MTDLKPCPLSDGLTVFYDECAWVAKTVDPDITAQGKTYDDAIRAYWMQFGAELADTANTRAPDTDWQPMVVEIMNHLDISENHEAGLIPIGTQSLMLRVADMLDSKTTQRMALDDLMASDSHLILPS